MTILQRHGLYKQEDIEKLRDPLVAFMSKLQQPEGGLAARVDGEPVSAASGVVNASVAPLHHLCASLCISVH